MRWCNEADRELNLCGGWHGSCLGYGRGSERGRLRPDVEKEAMMAHVEKSIEVDVPVQTAYNQWTQFESFPQFMEGVEEVQQRDDRRLHWRATIAGKTEEWDAAITQQQRDQVVAWRSTSGAENAGTVTFTPLMADRTRVNLALDYTPEGPIEKAGDLLGVVSRRVESDLKRFKDFIESRGRETGAWRGEIHGQQVEDRPSSS